jgi:hypothetical protein
MIIVIFPNGTKVQYNNATSINYDRINNGLFRLLNGAEIIAIVPKECAVSFQEPCDLKGPQFGDVDILADQILLRKKELSIGKIRKLRTELLKFSIRRNKWFT